MIAAVVFAALATQAPAQKVLVLDLRANAVPPAQVQTLQSTLVSELARVPGLDVMSGEDVRRLVQLEASKQAVGCDVDGSCLAEIAGALGAQLVVFGDVGTLGPTLIVNLSLFDAAKAQAASRARLEVPDFGALPSSLPGVVEELLRPVLAPSFLEAYRADVAARAGGGAIALKAKDGPPLYVVAPKVVQMAESVGATVSSLLAKTAEEEGFRTFTRDDAAAVLSREVDLQMLGADADGASLSELGKAVGVQHVLASVVSSVDGDVLVQARLIDVAKAAVVSRREVRASDHDGLIGAVEAATRLVLQPVFADQRGSLALAATEEGANVFVDEKLVGVTPLQRPLDLPGGHHLIVVEKEGFVRHAETVRMTRGARLERAVTLRPSVEFLEDYRTRNGVFRGLAWTTTGLTVATALAAGALAVPYALNAAEVDRLYADYSSRPLLTPAEEAEGQALIEAAQFQAGLWGGFAASSATVAMIAAASAAFFWVFGDDPGKYDALAATPAE